jgi:hypothetical protein
MEGKGMTITKIDVNIKDDKLIYTIFDLAQCFGIKCWVVGGYVRRRLMKMPTDTADVDFAFQTTDSRVRLVDVLPDSVESNSVRICEHYTSFVLYGREVQFLHRTGETLESHFNRFDFTICQFGADHNYAHASLNAITDLQDRRLSPTPWILEDTDKDRIRRLPNRILKYMKQGFNPSNADLLKILERYKWASLGESYNLQSV